MADPNITRTRPRGPSGALIKEHHATLYCVYVWKSIGHMDRKLVGSFQTYELALECAIQWGIKTSHEYPQTGKKARTAAAKAGQHNE